MALRSEFKSDIASLSEYGQLLQTFALLSTLSSGYVRRPAR